MNKYLYKICIYFHEIFTLVFFKRKLLLYKRHTEDLIMFIFFLILNLTALLLPRYVTFGFTYGNINKTRYFST